MRSGYGTRSPRRGSGSLFPVVGVVLFFVFFWAVGYFTFFSGIVGMSGAQEGAARDRSLRSMSSKPNEPRMRVTNVQIPTKPQSDAGSKFNVNADLKQTAAARANHQEKEDFEDLMEDFDPHHEELIVKAERSDEYDEEDGGEEEVMIDSNTLGPAKDGNENGYGPTKDLGAAATMPVANERKDPVVQGAKSEKTLTLSESPPSTAELEKNGSVLYKQTVNLYKSLKYQDLVEERWFDQDYDKEESHDMIMELGGDTLGDASRKNVHEAIPRKLHFTWKTDKLDELPELFRKIQLKWKMLNPGWEIKIWTDEECEKLVKDFYPEYFFFYSDFEVTAERSDIFRYLVLDHYGGYYADMDIEPLQPLDGMIEVVKKPECMIGLEPEVHAILAYNKYHVIGNAFMGSVPGHPLWKWLIPQTIKRYYADRSPKDEKDATKITGPIAVDNVIQRNPEVTRSCLLLKPDVTAPAYDLGQDAYGRCQDILERPHLKMANDKENPYVRICKEINEIGDQNKDYPAESFMVHHWAHTWRAKPDDDDNADKKSEGQGKGEGIGSESKQEPKIFAESNIGKEVEL